MESNLVLLLRKLSEAGVRFVVVDGIAAALHGVPCQTLDLDIVYARDPQNIARLLSLLDELEAIYRVQPEKKLRPSESHLASKGHKNFVTSLGPLDLLGTIGDDWEYRDLEGSSDVFEIADGLTVRALNLETQIKIKEKLTGERDREILPLLRRALIEKQKR